MWNGFACRYCYLPVTRAWSSRVTHPRPPSPRPQSLPLIPQDRAMPDDLILAGRLDRCLTSSPGGRFRGLLGMPLPPWRFSSEAAMRFAFVIPFLVAAGLIAEAAAQTPPAPPARRLS